MKTPDTCTFCSSKSVAACNWPAEKFTIRRWDTVQVGDRVKRAFEAEVQQLRPAAVVRSIGDDKALLWIRDPLGGMARTKTVPALGDHVVRVSVPSTCGKLCCERHHQERADLKTVCLDHWAAWESVA